MSAPAFARVDLARGSRLLVCVVGAIVAMEFATDVIYMIRYDGWGDLRVTYSAAVAQRAGSNIYDIDDLNAAWASHGDEELAPDIFHVFTYPPLFASALRPLTHLPFRQAARVWVGFNVLLWLICLGGTVRLLRATPRDPVFWLVWCIGLRFEPALSTFRFGQVNLILFALVLGSLLALRSRQAALSGGLLAAAVMVKLTPAALVGYYLVRREWRAVAWAVGVFVGLLLLGVAWLGTMPHLDYVTDVLPKLSIGFARPNNQSVTAWFLRLFLAAGWGQHLDTAILLARVAGFGIGLIALGAFLREPRPGVSVPGASLMLLAVSMISPVTWTHHMVWLILPIGVLLSHGISGTAAWGDVRSTQVRMGLLLASIAVVAVLDDYYVHPVFQSGPLVLISSVKLMGVIALFALTLDLMKRARPEAERKAA